MSIKVINSTEEMQKRIEDLTKQLKEQKEQNERFDTIVYQLLGGLFNQESQGNVLKVHMNILNPSEFPLQKDFDFKKLRDESSSPTTRQGDELEAKFAKQRKKYKKLKKRLKKLEAQV
jgi:cell division protein FtsB